MAKILGTFHVRQAVDKYANVATIAEIAENDFNLNIPRYVDTFEEEEEIAELCSRPCKIQNPFSALPRH